METLKATVKAVDGNYSILISLESEEIEIPLSEDKPMIVKAAFNKLILRLKDGHFKIQLEKDENEDLFTQVSKEYLIQLNREIEEVYGEMEGYGLIVNDKIA